MTAKPEKKKGLFGFGSSKKSKKKSYTFDELLVDDSAFTDFEDFLKKQCSSENLHFYKETSAFAALTSKSQVSSEATRIVEKFLGDSVSDAALNIGPSLRRRIVAAAKKPNAVMFEEARMDIEQLLRTSFVQFVSEL